MEQDFSSFASGEVVLEELPVSFSTMLQIKYEDGYSDDVLSELVEKELRGQEPSLHAHLDIGNEKAELVKYIQGNSTTYNLYTKHGDNYYHFIFSSSSAGAVGSPEVDLKLDELFFTTLGTFTFLN